MALTLKNGYIAVGQPWENKGDHWRSTVKAKDAAVTIVNAGDKVIHLPGMVIMYEGTEYRLIKQADIIAVWT